jgi:hypothetical protein
LSGQYQIFEGDERLRCVEALEDVSWRLKIRSGGGGVGADGQVVILLHSGDNRLQFKAGAHGRSLQRRKDVANRL